MKINKYNQFLKESIDDDFSSAEKYLNHINPNLLDISSILNSFFFSKFLYLFLYIF